MAWQGNGLGAAWERHAVCESAIYHLTVHASTVLRPPSTIGNAAFRLALGSCGGLKLWFHLPLGEHWAVKQPSQIASTTDVSIPHDCADVISIQTDATTLRGRPYSTVAYKWDPMTVCY